jgi:hypothetical protein
MEERILKLVQHAGRPLCKTLVNNNVQGNHKRSPLLCKTSSIVGAIPCGCPFKGYGRPVKGCICPGEGYGYLVGAYPHSIEDCDQPEILVYYHR